MEIATFLALMVAYVFLSRLKFAQQMDPKFIERQERRREIRERHARWRRRRANRNSAGTQEGAESSCCA